MIARTISQWIGLNSPITNLAFRAFSAQARKVLDVRGLQYSTRGLMSIIRAHEREAAGGFGSAESNRYPRAMASEISSTMAWAAARGSGAAVMGLPTTR